MSILDYILHPAISSLPLLCTGEKRLSFGMKGREEGIEKI
jgi:hypothetical protein